MTDKERVVYDEGAGKAEAQLDERVCQTCLRPAEPLILEGGLLFCEPCLKSYKELMAWMQGKV